MTFIRFLIAFIFAISSLSVFAQFPNAAFWKLRKATLKFTTGVQSTRVLNCSSVVTVQALNASGVATNVASPLTVNLSVSPSTLTFYSDSNCATPVTAITIPAGSSSASYYFVSTDVTAKIMTASATNYPDVTQSTSTLVNPFIWVGGGGDANWTTGANWSGGAAPGAGNQVIFNETCVTNCNAVISASISVAGVRILSGFTGSITQAASQNLTVGANGWYQEGSTFNGGAANFTMNGAYTLAAGTFNSPTGTDTIGSSFTLAGGTFSASSSTYVFNNRGSISTGNAVFNHLSMNPGNGGTYTITGTMFVNGNLVISNNTANATLSGGTIDVKGNVTVISNGATGSTVIKLSGTGTQNFDASGAAASRNLPSVTIASTGPVNLSGNLYISGSYLYSSSGTFNAGTSMIMFSPLGDGRTANMGPVTYYDAGFNQAYLFNLTADMNVSHSFTLATPIPNAGYISGPGKINLQGDLILNGSGEAAYGSMQFVLNGSGNQNVTVLNSSAYSPSFEINCTGTVNFPATFTFNDDFKYVQGTVVLPTTAYFAGHDGYRSVISSGSLMFNDVIFNGGSGAIYDITGMNIGGNMSLNSGSYSVLNGDINLYGNLSYTAFYSYNVALTFVGSGAQTLTSIGGSGPSTSFNVNKTGGSLKLLSSLSIVNSAWTQTSGGLDMNGFNLSVVSIPNLNGTTLKKSGGVLKVNGSTIGTGSLYGGTVAP